MCHKCLGRKFVSRRCHCQTRVVLGVFKTLSEELGVLILLCSRNARGYIWIIASKELMEENWILFTFGYGWTHNHQPIDIRGQLSRFSSCLWASMNFKRVRNKPLQLNSTHVRPSKVCDRDLISLLFLSFKTLETLTFLIKRVYVVKNKNTITIWGTRNIEHMDATHTGPTRI